MSIMQPPPGVGDGPLKPKGVAYALAGAYAAGYSAALGAGTTIAGATITETTVVILAQGATAALCWVFLRGKQM
ncbi:hypothetical protein ABZ400_02815 [Streptomyces sp. NPDC005897]|uniref:hypothetical protein n=1 Tax=Streptomyces sp. NPDC005897 TaxID=3157081 RepID=UPI0033DC7F40